MKKSTKILLLVAASLVVVGCIVGGVAFALGGRFEGDDPRTVTHHAEGSFDKVAVYIDTPELTVCASADGTAYAVCDESAHVTYELSIADGVLALREQDLRRWYHYIGVNVGYHNVTLYLPADTYASISIKTSSGEISCTDMRLDFGDASLSASSGDIKFSSPVSGNLTAVTSSGDIEIANVTPHTLTVTASSGEIEIDHVHSAELSVHTSSGEVELRDVVADEQLSVKTSSGEINLDRCDSDEMVLSASSGNIRATLLTPKLFDADSDSGRINCPSPEVGGKCTVRTSSGDIRLSVID